VGHILADVAKLGVPVIHFGTDTGSLLDLQREAGGTVIGVDWRTNLDEAWERIGYDVAIQGNLDPTVLFAPRDVVCKAASAVLRRAEGRPGHVFNLGHGILPGTPVENVQALIDHVHQVSSEPGRKVSSEPGRKVSSEPGRKVSSEPGRQVSSEPGRKVSSEPGRKVSSEPGRKVSSEPTHGHG
jgi:uroporphyrinogen decarboxylase